MIPQKLNRTMLILRNINGKYYDGNYKRIEDGLAYDYLKEHCGEYIVKPSLDSSGGKNIMRLKVHSQTIYKDENSITINDIERIIPRDFLVQEFLEQHIALKTIYSHSVNTLRVVTLRINDDIHALQTILKFGTNGNYTDYNVNQGGVHCGIDKNGKLNKFAVDKDFKKYHSHPDTGHQFENTHIAQFPSVLDFAKKLHRYLLYFDMVSWDIAIDKNGDPILLELNLINQGISFTQVHHGPLFGDFTEKLLEGNLKCYSI